MMPRRNHRFRRAQHAPRRDRQPPTVYHRDSCGKWLYPTYRVAKALAGKVRTELRLDDGGHYIYRCRWNGGWHLSSRTQSEVDARQAYYRHYAEEVNR